MDTAPRPAHQDTILPLTLGIANETWIVLDALRKKRNRNDYTGAPLLDAEAREAIAQAEASVGVVMAHLKQRHRRLLE